MDKWVSLGHYDLLVKYSTSMQQIYYMLHNDYDKIKFTKLSCHDRIRLNTLGMTPNLFVMKESADYDNILAAAFGYNIDLADYSDN